MRPNLSGRFFILAVSLRNESQLLIDRFRGSVLVEELMVVPWKPGCVV
jgi:hypothetical protein